MKSSILISTVALTLLCIGSYALVAQENTRPDQESHDQVLVEEVEWIIKRHLFSLKPDNEISRRYGKFIKLTGSGYERGSIPKIGGYIDLTRTAVFERANVECSVTVSTDPLAIHSRITPSEEWMIEHPQASLEKSGDVFVVRAPGMEIPTSIEIWSHYVNAADVDRYRSMIRSVDDALSDLAAGVAQDDRDRLGSARRWYESQELTARDLFLGKALSHQDVRVRLEVAKLLSLPARGYGKIFHAESTMKFLLDFIEGSSEDDEVRLEIVAAVMLSSETTRGSLYDRLRQMGTDGHFAVPALAFSLNDKDARHYRTGGAADAPIGAAQLLGEWGPAAVDAVPALVNALDNHPNDWNLAPAAAEALGKIGPAAQAAIPALMRARTRRWEVSSAAVAALEKIDASAIQQANAVETPPKEYEKVPVAPIETPPLEHEKVPVAPIEAAGNNYLGFVVFMVFAVLVMLIQYFVLKARRARRDLHKFRENLK